MRTSSHGIARNEAGSRAEISPWRELLVWLVAEEPQVVEDLVVQGDVFGLIAVEESKGSDELRGSPTTDMSNVPYSSRTSGSTPKRSLMKTPAGSGSQEYSESSRADA